MSLTAILPIICFALAAFFNAIMDTLCFHFETSKFRNFDPKFWNPNVSWKYIHYIPFTKYRVDAWHLCKSTFIWCLAGGITIAFTEKDAIINFTGHGGFDGLIYFGILGITWILTFNTFYNKILR